MSYHFYAGINEKEVSALVYWYTHLKTINEMRVYYDRALRGIIMVTPDDQQYDKIAYDPGRYKYIHSFREDCSAEGVKQVLERCLRGEIKQDIPIRTSLQNVTIKRDEDEND